MFNFTEANASAVKYWSEQPTDQPWLLNGFKGTWAFSDHALIPEVINEFILEYFRPRLGEMRKGHIKVIPLNEINDLLNEVWEGPGSMVKIVNMTHNMRIARLDVAPDDTKDPLKGYDTPTIESNLGENVVDRIEK